MGSEDETTLGEDLFEVMITAQRSASPIDTRDPGQEWVVRRAAIRFLDRSVDHINDFGPGLGEHCQLVWERTRQHDAPGYVSAYLGAISLNINLLHRRFGSPGVPLGDLAALFTQPAGTSYAIHRLYEPDAAGLPELPVGISPDQDFERRMNQPVENSSPTGSSNLVDNEWLDLDRHSLSLYRAGTTSAVFTAYPASAVNALGRRERVVVKCLMFPWNKSSSITKATAEYAATYGSATEDDRRSTVVVQPYNSSANWLIMAFQPGATLRETIDGISGERERFLFARQLAAALCDALGRLGSGPRTGGATGQLRLQHLDLSPNNVILDPGVRLTSVGADQLHFIDLGVNHLYTRQAGMEDHGDAVYTAPEVRARSESSLSDVYSLAVILAEVLTGITPRQGALPEVLYERLPDVALVLEDMLESTWSHRMTRLLPTGGEVTYPQLAEQLERAFELAEKEPWLNEGGVVSNPGVRRFLPGFSEPVKQLRRLRTSQGSRSRLDGSPRGAQSYLLVVSALASLAWLFALERTGFLDVGDFVQEFPGLPSLPSGIQLIAVAQALVVLKCYQTMFSRLPVWYGGGAFAWVTEVAVRLVPFIAVPTIIVSGWESSTAWAWSCALGAMVVAVANFGLWRIAARSSGPVAAGPAAPRPTTRLSSIPAEGYVVPKGFDQWWWTMLLYAVVILVIARGLQTGDLQDTSAYVFGLLLINIGIHYIAKISLTGSVVRGGLVKAFSANERTAVLQAWGRTGRSVRMVQG